MRIAAWLTVTLALLVGLAAAAGPASAGPREDYEVRRQQPPNVLLPIGRLGHTWVGDPPYVAGDSTYSRGELIYQDRPFDDTGADTFPDSDAAGLQDAYRGLCEATAAYRHGEYAYPDDPAFRRNGADLVELRVAADDTSYYVLFQLQTLIDPARIAARLAINGRHELLVHGAQATLDGTAVPAAADVAANTLEVRLPADRLPRGSWTVSAATGVPAEGATTWVDLAFVDEPIVDVFNCWQDKAQSAALAVGTAPTLAVDTDRLRAGGSDTRPVRRGPMVRLHAPFFDNGEGLEPEPTHNQQSTGAIYRGKLQPYAAYVPVSYDSARAAPLLVLLHCLNCNHNTFHNAAWPGLSELADQLGAVVVTPLAYGEGRHYEEEAELDVFEVLADVSSRYNIDADRLLLSGMSMGALGTFRLGLLYPDVWARTLGIGNYTTPYCVSPSADLCGEPNYTRLFQNARNLPWGLLNGTLDELTPVTLSRSYADMLDSYGFSYRFWEYAARRHEPPLHGLTVDATVPWLGDARRITNPARITYDIETSMFNPKFGLVYDRAYWLRHIRVAEGAERGRLDVSSSRGTVLETAGASGSGSGAGGPWTMRGLDPKPRRATGPNRVGLILRSISSLTIDPMGAGLTLTEPVTLALDTDTPVSVTVAGLGTVSSPAGGSVRVLVPDRPNEQGRAAPQQTGPSTLPRTGGGPSGGVLPLVALVALLAIRGSADRRPAP